MSGFEAEWARCLPWLQAALDRAPPAYAMDDVKAEVMAREARFWAGRKAALVTKIAAFPRLKVLNFWLGGGDLAEIRDEMVPAAEAYARELGCHVCAVAGRPGWSRVLGYAPSHIVCMKDLA